MRHSTTFRVYFFILFLAGLSPPALVHGAEEVALPPISDYVLRFTAENPSDEGYYSLDTSYITVGDTRLPYAAGSAQTYMGGEDFYQLSLFVFEDPVTLEQWLAHKAWLAQIYKRKSHETFFNDAMGQRTHVEYLSSTEKFEDGEFVAINNRAPTGVMYTTAYDGRAILEVLLLRDEVKLSDEDKAKFAAFAATVSVKYEDVFDTEAETYTYSTSDMHIHSTADAFIRSSLDMLVHRDWIVTETAIEAAGDGKPLGRFVLDIAPYDATGSETLKIVVEGLPVQRLGASVYRDATHRLISGNVTSMEVESTKDVTGEMLEFIFGGHCLASYAGNGTSNGVRAETFNGTDSSGQAIRGRVYSSGGYYMACTYLYTAPPDRYEQNIEIVEDMVKNLQVVFIGPPLER